MKDWDKSLRREKTEDYIDAHSKSPVAGVIYALFYGPFGLLYANPRGTVIALLLGIALGLIYWPLIGLVWLGGVITAPIQVRAYNDRLRRLAPYDVM